MPPATACPLEGGGSLGCLPPRLSPPRATRQHHAQSIRLTVVSLLLGTHPALGAVLSTPRPRLVPSIPRSSGYIVQSSPGAPVRACPPTAPTAPPLPNDGGAPRRVAVLIKARGAAYTKPGVFGHWGPLPNDGATPPDRLTVLSIANCVGDGAFQKHGFCAIGRSGHGGAGGARTDAPCTPRTSHAVPPLPPLTDGGGFLSVTPSDIL